MKIKDYREEIAVPEGTSIVRQGLLLKIAKGKVMVQRLFQDPQIRINVHDNKITIETDIMTRKEKMRIGTMVAHIKNMIRGVHEQYVYKLKVCSGHFPMNISISGKQFSVKNFVGEKIPRVLELQEGVEVKMEGNELIIVTSADKELAGRTAGSIELLCRRPGFDSRIFQQGIYIIEKAGKTV